MLSKEASKVYCLRDAVKESMQRDWWSSWCEIGGAELVMMREY